MAPAKRKHLFGPNVDTELGAGAKTCALCHHSKCQGKESTPIGDFAPGLNPMMV